MDILILSGNDDSGWTRDLQAISAPVTAELGCKVTIVGDADAAAMARHVRTAKEKYAALIITPSTARTKGRDQLRDAVAASAAFSVEVQLANPGAGSADPQARPVGTDAVLYGLGLDGYAFAIRLIHAKLGASK